MSDLVIGAVEQVCHFATDPSVPGPEAGFQDVSPAGQEPQSLEYQV